MQCRRQGGWWVALLLLGGCALPDYHLPHGFSSTYYRHLQQGQPMIAPAPTPPGPPADNEAGMPRTNHALPLSPPIGPKGPAI